MDALTWVKLIFILGLCAAAAAIGLYIGWRRAQRVCPNCGAPTKYRTGAWDQGVATRAYTCTKCEHVWEETIKEGEVLDE